MSRWCAAPPSTGVIIDWGQAFSPTEVSDTRPSHYSSPLSLESYRLIRANDVFSAPISPKQSYEQPSPHLTLPVELYRQIIQYVTSNHDICSLARVSHAFQIEAERVLYHSLHLRHHIKTLWRCESLSSQPRLALYVQRLSIILDQYTPLEPIARALNACRNLRHLALRGAPWSDYSKVLDAVTSMDIREFTCHARGEAGVVRFLERQSNMVEVDLEAHGFDLESLSQDSVNNLTTFTGWLTTAAAIVPGRPVRQLTLTSDMANDATVRAVHRLSKGEEDVTVLDIRMGVLRNPMPWTILESIFTSLKGLRFLGVCSLDCAKVNSFSRHCTPTNGRLHSTRPSHSTLWDCRIFRLSCSAQEPTITRNTMKNCNPTWSIDWGKRDWIWTRDTTQRPSWNSSWNGQGQEWRGTIANERINLEELARLHVDRGATRS
jgi:hypothetical protein